jgi:hypothetical protein
MSRKNVHRAAAGETRRDTISASGHHREAIMLVMTSFVLSWSGMFSMLK